MCHKFGRIPFKAFSNACFVCWTSNVVVIQCTLQRCSSDMFSRIEHRSSQRLLQSAAVAVSGCSSQRLFQSVAIPVSGGSYQCLSQSLAVPVSGCSSQWLFQSPDVVVVFDLGMFCFVTFA